MDDITARGWAYAAAYAGFIANGLFLAFYAAFSAQGFDEPHGVAAALGTASDAAGVPQNALLIPVALVVYGYLSPHQRADRILAACGVVVFAVVAACGVLTVAGLLDGVSWVSIAGVFASVLWLLAIGIRGARLPDAALARTARLGRTLVTGMLAGGLVTLIGFGIDVTSIAWLGLVLGALAWLAIPFWVLALGRSLNPTRSTASTALTPSAERSDA